MERPKEQDWAMLFCLTSVLLTPFSMSVGHLKMKKLFTWMVWIWYPCFCFALLCFASSLFISNFGGSWYAFSHIKKGDVDPIRDLETIHDELRLKDMEIVRSVVDPLKRLVDRGAAPNEKRQEYVMLTTKKRRREKRRIFSMSLFILFFFPSFLFLFFFSSH